jgi:hypothetical protein
MQDGIVDLQHGTGENGDLCLFVSGHHPKLGFSSLKTDKLIYIIRNYAKRPKNKSMFCNSFTWFIFNR